MNNDYGNYSREVAKIREDFNETSRKMKESYDKSIKDTQETSVRKEDELKRNHATDKERLIAENQDKLRLVSDKTNEILDRKQKEFLNGLKEEREVFGVEKNRMRENLQNSLINVKDSYTQSLDEFKLQSERLARDNEFKYLQSLQQNKNNTDKKIVEIQKKTDSMISKNNLDLADQKKEILIKNQKDLEVNNRGHKENLDKKTEYFNRKINEITSTKDDEITRQSDRYDGTLYKLKEDNREQVENMISRYEDHTKDMLEDFSTNFSIQEKQNAEEKSAIKAQANKDIYNVKRESALVEDKSVVGDSGAGQKAQIGSQYEKRLDRLKKEMSEQAVKFQRVSSDQSVKNQNKLKENDEEHRMKFDANVDENYKDKMALERAYRLKDTINNENYTNQIKDLDKSNTDMRDYELSTFKKKIELQKNEFGKTVNKLADLNTRNISRLQEESMKEKQQIFDLARKNYDDEARNLRQDYRLKNELIADTLNKRIESKDKELSMLKENSFDEIQKIKDQAERLIQHETNYGAETRENFRRTMLNELDETKRAYQNNAKKMKLDYDSSLQKVKRENDLMLARLNKKYEENLNKTETDKSKELKRISNEFKQSYERLALDSKIQRENLVDHYERRIQELKAMYETEKIKEREAKVLA